jgi:sporulation protein YlmC with PRC-barrel domain
MKEMNLRELSKKDVVSSDGRTIGRITGAIVTSKGNVSALSLKLNEGVADAMGKKTPVLSALRQDLAVQNVSGVTDKVVLNKSLSELGTHLTMHNEILDAKRLIGMEVTSPKGTSIGKVEDLIIDENTWKVPSIRVKVDKDAKDVLKMKSWKLAGKELDISLANVRDVGDGVLLNLSAEHMGWLLENTRHKTA